MTQSTALADMQPLDLRRIAMNLRSDEYKLGDEFKPFHPSASHVPPDYRDGWNRCWLAAREFLAAERIAPEGQAPTRAQIVMEHDYPILQQFHSKHSLGALSAPSCLCCGESTQGREVAIAHLELPAIVICKRCRDAAMAAPQAAQSDPGKDRAEALLREVHERLFYEPWMAVPDYADLRALLERIRTYLKAPT